MKGKVKSVARYGTRGMSTCLLIEALDNVAVGDTIDADQLHEACGKDVCPGESGYSALASAIRYHLGKGAVYRWQRGAKCVKNLTDVERLAEADSKIKHIRKSSRSALQNVGGITLAKIKGHDVEYGAKLAMLGSIVLFS